MYKLSELKVYILNNSNYNIFEVMSVKIPHIDMQISLQKFSNYLEYKNIQTVTNIFAITLLGMYNTGRAVDTQVKTRISLLMFCIST